MNKFSNIQCDNPYTNFTIHNYIECYSDLSEKAIERFTDLFKNLKNHKISIGNYLVDRKPLQGVKLTETKKEKSIFENDLGLRQSIIQLSASIDQENKKEVLFYNSILHFSDSISYLSSIELKELNDLFVEVHSYQCNINAPIATDQLLFYSYNRYPHK